MTSRPLADGTASSRPLADGNCDAPAPLGRGVLLFRRGEQRCALRLVGVVGPHGPPPGALGRRNCEQSAFGRRNCEQSAFGRRKLRRPRPSGARGVLLFRRGEQRCALRLVGVVGPHGPPPGALGRRNCEQSAFGRRNCEQSAFGRRKLRRPRPSGAGRFAVPARRTVLRTAPRRCRRPSRAAASGGTPNPQSAFGRRNCEQSAFGRRNCEQSAFGRRNCEQSAFGRRKLRRPRPSGAGRFAVPARRTALRTAPRRCRRPSRAAASGGTVAFGLWPTELRAVGLRPTETATPPPLWGGAFCCSGEANSAAHCASSVSSALTGRRQRRHPPTPSRPLAEGTATPPPLWDVTRWQRKESGLGCTADAPRAPTARNFADLLRHRQVGRRGISQPPDLPCR